MHASKLSSRAHRASSRKILKTKDANVISLGRRLWSLRRSLRTQGAKHKRLSKPSRCKFKRSRERFRALRIRSRP